MAASSPSAATLGGAIRDTDEYAAAFDLEVWKAQQQLHYQAQLRQAKESLEHRLRTQMRQSEQKKLAELEGLRHELETMGRRLQIAEESLVRRAAQLDAREAAFNAKRVKVAEQHEAYVARVEERERRTREEAQLTQSSLHARLQEKDEVIAQLQGRLSTAQQEYELLRRRAARHLTEQTDTDGQRLRDQECALALAQAQLTEVQRQLREKTAEAERAAEDRVQLQGQLRETARQLSLATRKYHRLTEASQAREWERLRREQDALEIAKQTQTLLKAQATVNGAAMRPERGASSSPPLLLRSSTPLPRAGAEVGVPGRTGGRDEFYDMLAALKQEVIAGTSAVARSGNRPGNNSSSSSGTPAHSLPFRIVERPPSGGASHQSTPTINAAAAATKQSQQQQQQISFAEQDELASTAYAESEIPRDETSSVSAALSAIPGVQAAPVQQPSSSSPPYTDSHRQEGRCRERDDVVVDMGDTSIDSYQYPRADLPSWANSRVIDDDDDNTNNRHAGVDAPAVEPLMPPPPTAAARAGTLPPLAPELRGLSLEDEADSSAGHTTGAALRRSRAHVSPTPDDFVMARDASLTDATARTQASRRDMVSFVQELKRNREKLLETGVYTEQDHVVREMGEKIQMYEEYLVQHP